MDAEPASKRRRKDQPPAEDWEDEEDDEELAFQPFGQEAKRDSGYRFSIERAYSDHRFQATMSHIFEKYGRNFEGIGDEIDLATGEIVVDNGHIHNMQNEGDVGDDFLQEEDDEEDEGILLEELTDGEDEQTGQVEEDGESEPEHGCGEQKPQGRNQKDHSTHDVESPHHHSMALVTRPPVENLEESWARQPMGLIPGVSWPSPYGSSPFGFGFGAGAGFSSPAFGPSPFSFDASPFPAAPWDIPGPHFEPQWAHPAAQPAQSLFAGHRYNFKAQRGQSSIWARRSKYKEDENEPLRSVFDIALHKHLSGAKPKARKSLPAPAAVPMPGGDDEDEEEAILSGKPVREKMPSIERAIDISHSYDGDQEDSAGFLPIALTVAEKHQDLGKSRIGENMGQDIHQGTPANPPAKRGQKKRRRSTRNIMSAESGHEASIRSVDASADPDVSNGEHKAESDQNQPVDKVDVRRSSSRTREEVKSFNRILDHKTLEEGGLTIIRVEIPSLSRHSRCEYQTVEVIDSLENDCALSEGDERPSAPITKPSPVQKPVLQGTNHDLEQDLAQEIGDDREDLPCPASDYSPVHTLTQDSPSHSDPLSAEGSVFVPSDDEAPPIVALVKIDGRGRMTRSGSKRRSQMSIGAHESALELRADFEAKKGGEQNNEVANAFDLAKTEKDPERREISESSMDSIEAYSEPNDEVGQVDHRVEDVKSDKDEQLEIAEFENVFAHPSGCSREAVPFSSSPTHSLTRFTARISLNNKPRPPREMPWLRKRAATPFPSSPVLDETPSSPTAADVSSKRRGRSRSRKWIDAAEQPDSRKSDDGSRASSVTTRNSIRKSERDSLKRPLELQIAGDVTEASTDIAQEDASIEATRASPELDILPTQASAESTSLPSSPQPAILHDLLAPQPSNVSQLPSTKKLRTPRHRRHISTRSPSSRRSITSIIGNHADNEEVDELRRTLAAMPGGLHSSGARSASARKIWRSSALTTEIYHTPVKKPSNVPVSPGSLIRTPGGTMRACGRNGYRCGRDFCFTCL